MKKICASILNLEKTLLFYMCLIDLLKLYLFMNTLFVYEIPVVKTRLCYILVQ